MIYKSLLAAAALGPAFALTPSTATAGPDEYLGEIITVGYNFCPRGTAQANGQLMPIAQYTALFSLYGTIYGGDGRTTFALPDLRGRMMVGEGTGPGLSNRRQGERAGSESHIAGPAPSEVEEASQLANSSTGNNMPPYLVMRHCVVLEGIYPSRN